LFLAKYNMALTRIQFNQINTSTAEAEFNDPTLLLNKNQTGSNDKDAGLIIERGDDTNVALIWDESADKFALITTTGDGTTRGNITISSYADLIANNVTVDGNLTVNGTTTTINSTTMSVDDLNLTLASGAADGAAANGAGITVDGASATLVYATTGDKWQFNKPVEINGTLLSTTGTVTLTDNLSLNSTSKVMSQGTAGYNNKQYILHGVTTDDTETQLYIGGAADTRIPVATNTTIFYECNIAARRTDAPNESAGWELQAVVDNFSGTTADVGDVYEIAAARDDASWLVDCRADNTNDTINVYVTGAAGKTIRWVAVVQTMEITV
jgi:hypothetical protein